MIKMENKIADDERKRREREEREEEEYRARKAMLKAKRKAYERTLKREHKRLEAAKRKEAEKAAKAAKAEEEEMSGLQKAMSGAGVLAAFGSSSGAKAGALQPLAETKGGEEATKEGGEAAGPESLALGESSVNDLSQTPTLPAASNMTATVVPTTPAGALAPVKPSAKVSAWVSDPRTPEKNGLGPVKVAANKVVPSGAQEIIDIANRKNSELERDTRVHVADIDSTDVGTSLNGPAEDVTKTTSLDTPGAFTEDDGVSVDHASIGGTASVSTYSTALTSTTMGTSVPHQPLVRFQPVAGNTSDGAGSSRGGRGGGRAGGNSNQLEDLERGEQEVHDDLEEEEIT